MRALAKDGERPSPAQLLARAEAWRPWRAYGALHLWTSEARAQAPETAPETAPMEIADDRTAA
jgi:3-methyladenine DNA glycosylase/8-oxoguanine DNA glycosylase